MTFTSRGSVRCKISILRPWPLHRLQAMARLSSASVPPWCLVRYALGSLRLPACRNDSAPIDACSDTAAVPQLVAMRVKGEGLIMGGCVENERVASLTHDLKRNRMGPRKFAASTTLPFCTMSISARCANRRAARRTGSINGRQSSGWRCRATSDGQMVAFRWRPDSSSIMVTSRYASRWSARSRRHFLSST